MSFIRAAGFSLGLLLGLAHMAPAGSWPQFRGPDGQGHSPAKGLPLNWSETENVAWKVALPGRGWSSPVIAGEQLWLTTAQNEGRSLAALCVSTKDGKLLRNVEVISVTTPGPVHGTNSYASPTPIIEDDRVYVHFGSIGTACLTTEGEIVWSLKLPHVQAYGPSSTPVLYKDLLIIPCHGTDVRYLVALDKDSGDERWKIEHEGRYSETTPLVIQTAEGDQLICNFADHIVSVDPQTGNELWTAEQGDNFAQIPRPVFGHGMVYICGGYFDPVVQAIRPDGRGDVTKTHVAWSMRHSSVPQNPSPVLVGDELYMVGDKGIATCLDAHTGKLHWRERLGGGFYASLLSADGRIYFFDDTGTTTVIKPGPHFEVLAKNKLDGKQMASPAPIDKALYLRTDSHLYRLENGS
ncbi:MAG TPA: PQQ-binding-like beta-propeller repeat protein [Planctomycetaceae bacterium]|nr:PQQ-binding-like beta-propeller repeat protein [Planctomycetaceae bacterium]